jgi:thiol-disulfide isomerase/thioredoxin
MEMTNTPSRRELLALVPFAAAAAPATPLPPLDEAGFQKLLAANKGKVVLVDFWATWCEPCRKEMPLISKMSERLRAKGLVVITVSADEPEDNARAREFLNAAKFSGPSYLKQ